MCSSDLTPAKLAGVGKIVVATPPNKQGRIEPIVLVAADICGADIILKIGGAHAIAALAVGTQSVPQVDKIIGPGGAFATTAKYLVSDIAAIDMLAGPTELVILADDSTNPRLVALDIISQAEHSSDTGCYIITTSQSFAKKVSVEIAELVPSITRKDIVQQSLQKNGFIAVGKLDDVILLANKIAPEHIQIMTKNTEKTSKKITSAGLVLVGTNTPSAASDYLLGTNHILPTNKFEIGRAHV